MACKTTLIGAITSLAAIDLHTNLCKGCFEDQQYLTTLPLLRKGELMLIQSMLVSNALWFLLAIEAHTVLVSAKTLQFPARGNTYLGPLATIAAIGTLEVPLYHIVTTMTTQILSLSFHSGLRLHQQRRKTCQCQKKNTSHSIAIHYL